MDAPPNIRIAVALLTLLTSYSVPAAGQIQQPGLKTRPPWFSLAIDLPHDAIRGGAEIPLEITMTNTSTETFSYGVAFGPPLWTDLCHFDVRDSGGRPVEEKPSFRQFIYGTDDAPKISTFGGPALFLKPGEKVHVEVLLNRIYNLSNPGRYTIRALRSDGDITVVSNTLTATIPGTEDKTPHAKSRFTISLTTPYLALKTGYQVPLNVSIKNVSKQEIVLGTWQEDIHVGAGTGHEFASGIRVRGPQDYPAPKTKEGVDLDVETIFPAGRSSFIRLEPGETYEEAKIVGRLYDLTGPGKYEFQVALFDPKTNLEVRSNSVTVNVLGPDDDSQLHVQPPFLLDIRAIEDPVGFGFKTGIYLAITNASDHQIEFDIGYGDNDVDVYDRDGNLAPLTDNGHRYRGSLPRGSPPKLVRIQPGETSSGGAINLNSLYDLTRPGIYTVQVKAFDGESKGIVKSNRIRVTIDK